MRVEVAAGANPKDNMWLKQDADNDPTKAGEEVSGVSCKQENR